MLLKFVHYFSFCCDFTFYFSFSYPEIVINSTHQNVC